jgi:hypothetical protein
VLSTPVTATKSFQLTINIYKGENLIKKSDLAPINPFVSVRVGGFVEKTATVSGN